MIFYLNTICTDGVIDKKVGKNMRKALCILLLISCIVLLTVYSASGKINEWNSVFFQGEKEKLYQDLYARVNDPNIVYLEKGAIKVKTDVGALDVLWLTETCPVGRGVIGAYKDDTFIGLFFTETVLTVRKHTKTDYNDLLIVKVRSISGTSVYGESLYLFNPVNINTPLWHGIVKISEEGIKGRNSGCVYNAILLFSDIDLDKRDELLVISSEIIGTYEQFELDGLHKVNCEVYQYNVEEEKYVLNKSLLPNLVFPNN